MFSSKVACDVIVHYKPRKRLERALRTKVRIAHKSAHCSQKCALHTKVRIAHECVRCSQKCTLLR